MIAAVLLILMTVFLPGTTSARPSSSPSSPQEQARFLAGLPLSRGSALSSLQKSPEYRSYRKELIERWRFCKQARYGPMQGWASVHVARHPSARGVLRYLFGGPDFLNAHAFFPDARIMVLGGLEPVGEVPPPENLSPAELGLALKSLDEALRTSLFAGYFITSEMRPQLAAGAFRGVLPVLYTELALTGNIIDSVTYERPFGSPGARITYHGPGGPTQTLWYFQADVSNGRECRRFLAWLGEFGPGASYLKAASYLLPLDSFSEARDFLIRTSDLILQDDSGLPFRCFLPGVWRLSLFGAYTDPLPIFGLKRDPELAKAYESPQIAGPLPFGAGYHVNPSDANLLLAVRADGIQQPPPPVPAGLPATEQGSDKGNQESIPVRKALPVPIRRALPTVPPTPIPIPVVEAPHIIQMDGPLTDSSGAGDVKGEPVVPLSIPTPESSIMDVPVPDAPSESAESPLPIPVDPETLPNPAPPAAPSLPTEETPMESPSGQG